MSERLDIKDIIRQICVQIDQSVRLAVKEELKLNSRFETIKTETKSCDFLSAEQAAVFLKRKLPTIYKDVRLGKIPHYRSGPRKLLFSITELEEFIKKKKGSNKQSIKDEVSKYILSSKEKRKKL